MNEVDELLLDNFSVVVIEHAGVKGMKWGVRRQRRVDALARGGTKGGFKSSRVRSALNLGPVDLIKGRGVRGGAARKAVRVGAQLERQRQGKSTAMDLIKRYGSTHVTDIVPVRASKANMSTTHKRDAAFVAAAGALIAVRVLRSAARARALS